MRTVKTIIFSLVLFLLLAMSGVSFAQTGAKDDAKSAGHETKEAAKDTGKAVKKGSKKAAHTTAKKTKQGAEKVEDKTR